MGRGDRQATIEGSQPEHKRCTYKLNPGAFKSIVGNGTASIIDNLDEARQGLALLMKQQAGMEHVEFTDQQVRAVTVWKVEADYFTAKVREKPQPHMH